MRSSIAVSDDLEADGAGDRVAGATSQDTGGAARVVYLKTNGKVSSEEKISLSESSFGLPIKDSDIDEDGAVDRGAVFISSYLNNIALVTDIYVI